MQMPLIMKLYFRVEQILGRSNFRENAEVQAYALQEEQSEQVETSEGNGTIVYEEPEEKTEQAETVEERGTVVYEEKEIGEQPPLEQEQPVDASWSSPLATGLSPAAAFGTRIHPVFGTEAFHNGVDLAAEAVTFCSGACVAKTVIVTTASIADTIRDNLVIRLCFIIARILSLVAFLPMQL